ncbi:cobalamin biosynthesis protein [Mesorhizobium sp. ZMM04-5]|uniref:Cobalamin biosynthesis protein n=1 Tax=Mesorhizobium marinum TaxID=3228790 RepID=A0ABV3QVH4_9HYPH
MVAGIGSRKGVSATEVVAAVEAALREHGLERGSLARLATVAFKREERGIFEAGAMLGLEVVVVVDPTPSSSGLSRGSAVPGPAISGDLKRANSPNSADPRDKPEDDDPDSGEEKSLSFKLAGVASVSEAAALAAAGEGARLAGPRTALGNVTCAIAFGAEA